jgi:S1-C subfamily serine protease
MVLFSPFTIAADWLTLSLSNENGKVAVGSNEIVTADSELAFNINSTVLTGKKLAIDYINPEGTSVDLISMTLEGKRIDDSSIPRFRLTHYPDLVSSIYRFYVRLDDQLVAEYSLHTVSGQLQQLVSKTGMPISYFPTTLDVQALANGIDSAQRVVQTTPSVRLRGGEEVYERVSPSVVLITTGSGIGTGVVISENDEIITNWHVIKDSDVVSVYLRPSDIGQLDENQGIMADVVKVDQIADLALLRLRYSDRELEPLEMEESDQVRVAQKVHAIGHPYGEFWTYTQGMVSQKRAEYEWQTAEQQVHRADIIQTQTPINPGNSGGPLITDEFKLAGINSFVAPQAQGLNYAVSTTTIGDFLARSDSRYFPRAEQQVSQWKGKKKSKRSKKQRGQRVDLNKDGVKEALARDLDGNGIAELFEIDQDGDGEVDFHLMDQNENGEIDTLIQLEPFMDDAIMVWHIDEDEDGIVDYRGLDIDLDGEIDAIKSA